MFDADARLDPEQRLLERERGEFLSNYVDEMLRSLPPREEKLMRLRLGQPFVIKMMERERDKHTMLLEAQGWDNWDAWYEAWEITKKKYKGVRRW